MRLFPEAESAPETQGRLRKKVADEVASAEAESTPGRDASVKGGSASEAQEKSRLRMLALRRSC